MKDTIFAIDSVKPLPLQKILNQNIYLNTKAKPEAFPIKIRNAKEHNLIFYVLAAIALFFAVLKFLYQKYFYNLFKVFFNSTLRQSQLTDQLTQDNLPSLLFNILFILSASLFTYEAFIRINYLPKEFNSKIAAGFTIGFAVVYLTKFLSLKFTGWLTNYKEQANTYIFIVFLVNKILGICLLPILFLITFSNIAISDSIFILALMLILLLLLFRFVRSYGLLQYQVRVKRFHFFLYIFAMEILPILVLCKGVTIFLIKKL